MSAAELGLSPLAFVLTAGRPAADQPTELESRLAAVFAAQVTDPAETDRIELDGASLLTAVAAAASRLVSGCRPLQVSDLTPPGGTTGGAGGPAGAVDEAELRERADAALAALREAHATIESTPPEPGPLRRVLDAVSELVGVDALVVAADAEALSRQASDVAALLAERIASARELRSRPLGAGETDVDRLVALVRTALGPHQPILPVFTLTAGAELAASASDRAALLGGD